MRFARIGSTGEERPVVIVDGRMYSLDGICEDIDQNFWANDVPGEVASAISRDALAALDETQEPRFGPPIARPGAIVCVGMNYAAHAAESGSAPPENPVIFLKVPNTVVGPYESVAIPRSSTKTDWEVELGVVIGRHASYLENTEEANACIGGYVTVNDLSERDFQLSVSGGQWSKGKNCPGFTPVGPWLMTASDVVSDNLRLRSWVNGDLRQDSSSSDMIFSVPQIIHHLSQYMVLDPGDLILTGTPQGVALSGRFPYLAPGDLVEVEVDGLGRQRVTMTEWTRSS